MGRHALVWLDGEPLGELGLGDLESTALTDAAEVLRNRNHRTLTYDTAAGPVTLFVEVQQRPTELVIVGAGHIAVPLARLGKLCDFTVTVLDDRPQFANRQRFPDADEVLTTPLRETMRDWVTKGRLDNDTCVVLVTHGHQHDIDCLLEILDAPLAYIGMIGSQRRVRTVFDLLTVEQGIPGKIRPRLRTHRPCHRRPHPRRNRRLHHGRDHQRPPRSAGGPFPTTGARRCSKET